MGDPPVPLESSWILLSRNSRLLDDPLMAVADARPLLDLDVLFTDRYSNLFRVLK
jgi:hypothetical protein